MSELKPCPFCGSSMCQTYLMCHTYLSGEFYYARRNIMCTSTSGLADTKDDAIKAWNRRAEVKDYDADRDGQ